jgi:hypothetical protein
MLTRKRRAARGLFNTAKNAPKHPIVHYGTAESARNSIRRLTRKDKGRARQLATRMYYRAKYHKHQTKGMRAAMKIWGRYLKTFKHRGGSNFMAKYSAPEVVHDNGKKAMVIVEPRKHENLGKIIANFHKDMPKVWELYLFYGKGLGDYAKEATKSVKGRKVFLKELDTDNLHPDQYSELMKSSDFWNKIDAETILIFQTDAAMCKMSKFKINKFLKYDYIGCSLGKWGIGKEGSAWGIHNMYGVGGVSLRKKSFMLKCIADNPDVPSNFPEDVFYSDCVAHSANKPENAKTLSEFCSQATYDEDSIFVHKPAFMDKNHKRRFLKYCPEGRLVQGGGGEDVSGNVPTFHIFIPTIGKTTLKDMLNSLTGELKEGDAITVVFDGQKAFDKSGFDSSWFKDFKCSTRHLIEEPELGFWSHGLANKYQSQLTPTTTFIMHADDDDVYIAGSFEKLRNACKNPNCLYIAKMKVIKNGQDRIVPGFKAIFNSHIGTPNGIIPFKDADKAKWGLHYGGDHIYYSELQNKVECVEFLDDIIYEAR